MVTKIGLFYVISKATDSSIILSDSSSSSSSDTSDKDILCHGHILNALSDNIYKIFCHTKTAIELWEALELKYGSAEKGLSRYSCEKVIEFQMVDNKLISDQIHEFENIVHDMKLKNIILPDIMLVALLISKLPPSWSDSARSLKHKPENFSFDDLLVCLRIEEKHRFFSKFCSKLSV